MELAQGEEMGRFQLGSTVVMLFPQSAGVQFNTQWEPTLPVQLGQVMAQAQSHLS